jgi:flagellin
MNIGVDNMRLNNNMASLNIYKEYSKVLTSQSRTLDRISSGLKVNKAKDNPNSLSKSEKLRMQIRGLQMASSNVQDGSSMLQTADGGLDEVTSMLQRIRELTVQAGSAANNSNDNLTIQNEINQMLKGIDSISTSTQFNGIKLLQIDTGDNNKVLSMAIGANPDEKIDIKRFNLVSNGDLNLSSIDVTNQTGVSASLIKIDTAIDTVLSARSYFGAIENRFESGLVNISEIGDKIQTADSELRDADIAEEMVEYAKANILIETGNAMMVQSNKLPQDVLRILEKR